MIQEYPHFDIWAFNPAYLVITTNTVLKLNGQLVMGAGLAKQAADRAPTLAIYMGNWVKDHKDEPTVYHYNLNCFDKWEGTDFILIPTKRDWRKPSKIEYIQSGLTWLSIWAHKRQIKEVPIAIPPMGCGLGGLNYPKQVKPLILETFKNYDGKIYIQE